MGLHYRNSKKPFWYSNLLQFFKIIVIELKLINFTYRISKNIEIFAFYVGGAYLFPPILLAKILKKKVIVFALGLGSLSSKTSQKNFRIFAVSAPKRCPYY